MAAISRSRAWRRCARGSTRRSRELPPLIRRYIKTSFVFLFAGLLLGGYITVAQFMANVYPPRLFITAHVHLLLVGFMLMIVMGVATWMFPRPARDDTRYRPELAEAVYWIMTVATSVRAIAEVTAPLTGSPGLRILIAVGGLGQILGAALFIVNMWWRVRMPMAAPPSR
jgi:heme/copper-type cytochrome/quinol oxidase subunit 1